MYTSFLVSVKVLLQTRHLHPFTSIQTLVIKALESSAALPVALTISHVTHGHTAVGAFWGSASCPGIFPHVACSRLG